MAELFLGRRLGPGGIAHPVVIKRLRPEMERDPAMVRMFLREAWIMARLSHPNVVRFHDFLCHAGRHYLVMEHVPGCDLSAAARHQAALGRPFPILEAIAIGIGVLQALGHAHALRDDEGLPIGLVHRDVSPQNVLLSVEGEIKLTDFGVAKATAAGAARDSGAGLVKGKLGYLAPEQLRGQPVDARTDLFGVGVILFELLAGRRLFQGSDEAAKVRAALAGEVPALLPLRPGCPALLEEVVRRALAREPAGRFESAARMADALADVQTSLRAEAGGRAPGPTLGALVREVGAARMPASAPGSAPAPAGPPPPRAGGVAVRRGGAPSAAVASVDRDGSTVRMATQPVDGAVGEVARRVAATGWRALLPWDAVAALAFAAGAATVKAVERWRDRVRRVAPSR